MDQKLTNRISCDHDHIPWVRRPTGAMIITILCLLVLSLKTIGQTDKYNQWNNEFQFAHPFNDTWAGELWLGSAFSSTPNEPRVFKTNIQRYATAWVHYFLPTKWKFSANLKLDSFPNQTPFATPIYAHHTILVHTNQINRRRVSTGFRKVYELSDFYHKSEITQHLEAISENFECWVVTA